MERHGRFQGQLDPPLDDEGRAQAARTAPHLAAVLHGQDVVLVSSDLQRAVDTAGPLAALLGVPVQVDERLREHGLGSWEGLTRDEVAERHPGSTRTGWPGARCPDAAARRRPTWRRGRWLPSPRFRRRPRRCW